VQQGRDQETKVRQKVQLFEEAELATGKLPGMFNRSDPLEE